MLVRCLGLLSCSLLLAGCGIARAVNHQHDYDAAYYDQEAHQFVDLPTNLDDALPPPPGEDFDDNPSRMLVVLNNFDQTEKVVLANIEREGDAVLEKLPGGQYKVTSNRLGILHQQQSYQVHFRRLDHDHTVVTVMNKFHEQLPVKLFAPWWEGLEILSTGLKAAQ